MSETPAFSVPHWHPDLVGQIWGNYCGASALSVLVRLVRLNYLESGDVRDSLGISIRRRSDVFGLLTRDRSRLEALAHAQPFDAEFIRMWHPTVWWPYANAMPLNALDWSLRICPECMRFAYHSLLFQMPGVNRCPWHHTRLVSGCVRCGKPLFDGFHHGRRLLQCTCGYDHVDNQKAVLGDTRSARARQVAIAEYRNWARDRQRQCWLVAPEIADEQGWLALSKLACQPFGEHDACRDMVFDHVVPAREGLTALGARSGLEKFQPTLASVPPIWLRDSASICRRLSAMMPPGTLSHAERRALDPHGAQQPEDAGGKTTRPWLLGFPGHLVGDLALLHTAPVDGVTLRVIARLAYGLHTSGYGPIEPTKRREFRKWIHEAEYGPSLLEAALRRVLFRGYADGCRVLLGQLNPDLYGRHSTRPARRFPWVELRLAPKAHAKIAWTRQMIA
ncbi:MAG TPA: hypothetical protein VF292_00375 [Rhodanobacteraceae bacterium]